MPGGFIAIFIAFAVVAVIAGIYHHKKEKERTAKLSTWAHASSMNFNPERDRGLDDSFPLSAFRRGSGRYGYNLARGERDGYPMMAGDYHYETHSTDSKGRRQTHHHHFSFALFRPPFPLRKLSIRKEGMFDKVSAAFGFDDIDFESAEFSKKFHVKSDDRRWAYDVIHPRTMELLMSDTSMRLECIPEALIVFAGRRWEIAQFEHYAKRAIVFLEGIPQHARGKHS